MFSDLLNRKLLILVIYVGTLVFQWERFFQGFSEFRLLFFVWFTSRNRGRGNTHNPNQSYRKEKTGSFSILSVFTIEFSN
jgi:hypothetical protein